MKKLKNLVLLLSAAALSCSAIACGGNGGGEAPHKHTYSKNWAYTDTHHYHEATCGHDVKPENSDGYAQHVITNDECSVCDYVSPLTLDAFVASYNTTAQNFVNTEIRPSVVEDNEVKAEQWYIVGNSDNALSEINIVWTYVVNDTDRKVEIAKVTLPTPIPFRKIINDSYELSASELEIARTDAFEFNAKTNNNKQELASALLNAAGILTTEEYPNKIYQEVDSQNEFFRAFQLFDQTNNRITIKRIYADKGDGTDEYAISNLHGPSTTIKATYEIEGTSIYNSAYTLENLGPEEEKPNGGDDDNGDDDEPITNAEILAALEENCVEDLLANCFTFEADTDLIENDTWYINKNTDSKITSVEYVFIYKRTTTLAYFTVGKIEFVSPISVQDLKNGNIGNPTYSRPYRFDYNPTIQSDRATLTNAICNKVFGENENAIRYIVDKGTSTSDFSSNRFFVVEITNNQINEISINIKNSSNDDEYISKLSNSSNYETFSEQTYDISGTKLTA